MFFEPAHVIDLRLRRTPHIEVAFARFRNREVADELALFIEHRCQHQAARFRHHIGHKAREIGFCASAREFIFRKVCDFGDAHFFAHAFALGFDMREIIRTAEGENIFLRHAFWREPERRFQAP